MPTKSGLESQSYVKKTSLAQFSLLLRSTLKFSAKLLWMIYLSLNFFFLFMATPAAYGSSQARSQIGAAASGLSQTHQHRSEPHL